MSANSRSATPAERHRTDARALAALALAACVACARSSTADDPKTTTSESAAPLAAGAVEGARSAQAKLGQLAPDFTLPDPNGKPVRLADLRGRVVVLEWFDPECAEVELCHERGSLARFPNQCVSEGMVWLAINSSAPGTPGAEPERNFERRRQWNMSYPILLDGTGAVARSYGARSAPHLFVIDEEGVLIYAGAIDDDPSGAASGAGRTCFVQRAIEERRAGVTTPETEPYGCPLRLAD